MSILHVSRVHAEEARARALIPDEGFVPCGAEQLAGNDVAAFHSSLQKWPDATDWIELLESRVSQLTGYPNVTLVSQSAAALRLALAASGIQSGDEVVIPSFAPVSVADAICDLKAVPVLVDIDPTTLHLDSNNIATVVTDRTRAIVPVNTGGLSVAIEPIRSIADQHGLMIVEEALQSLPGILKADGNQRGDAVCIHLDDGSSTSVNQVGAICTFDERLAGRLRNGITHNSTAQERPCRRHRPSQLASAWELARLTDVPARWRRRCEITLTWSALSGGMPQVQVPAESSEEPHSWSQYLLRLNLQHLAVSRDDVFGRLRQRGVPAGVHYLPIHMHARYQEGFGFSPESFPVSRNEFLRELTPPLQESMPDEEVERIWDELRGALQHSSP